MLAAGSTINQRYRLTSLIGEGGMASVWRAQDQTLQRDVAIKLLYLQYHGDPQASIDQFLREARIAAAVQHRHVVHTLDFGTSDGIPFIVLELLQGESLAERMAREPALELEAWLRLMEQVLRGLSAVHEAGIVHRDLKPQNVFLHRDADSVSPKILDFGISRSLAASPLASPIATQQGLVIGTPHYMAPEQARGEADIDKRADIYSVGAMLYEGIAGQPPFDAPSAGELLVKILSSEPTPLRVLRPDLPELIAHCVGQAMAHDREQRFVDAKAFRSALQLALQRTFTGGGSELPLPAAVQAGHGHRWGDFEGLASPRASVSVRAPAPVELPRVARARARTRPSSIPVAAGSDAQPLLGDNPLDMFAGSAALELELDPSVGHLDPAVRRSAERVGKRVSVTGSQPHVGLREGRAPAVSRGAGVWWILPSVLCLVLLAVLLRPGLFSSAPPDPAAARAREALEPATHDSRRSLRSTRQDPRVRPGAPRGLSGPLRELLE